MVTSSGTCPPPAVPLQRPTARYVNIRAYSFCERMLSFFLGHSLYLAYAEGRMVCMHTPLLLNLIICVVFPQAETVYTKNIGVHALFIHYTFEFDSSHITVSLLDNLLT